MRAEPEKRARTDRRGARGAGAAGPAMPGFIEFCDPAARDKAPEGKEWLYEIKTDGYRAQVHIRAGKVKVYSRAGYDWTEQFSFIAQAAASLHVRDAIIHGEATVIGATGLPDLQALRREL